MAVLPQLPPAAQDFKVEVSIPAALAPYMDMIKSIAAPNKTYEEWFSGFLVLEGRKFLHQYMAQQIMSQATKTATDEVNKELDQLLGVQE